MTRCFITQIIAAIIMLKATWNLTYSRLKINDISHTAGYKWEDCGESKNQGRQGNSPQRNA